MGRNPPACLAPLHKPRAPPPEADCLGEPAMKEGKRHRPKLICLLAVNVLLFICSNATRRCVEDVTQLRWRPSAHTHTRMRTLAHARKDKRECRCSGPLVSTSHHGVAPDVLEAAERGTGSGCRLITAVVLPVPSSIRARGGARWAASAVAERSWIK